MHLGLQLQDQHLSSTESTYLHLQEFKVMGKTCSQDQCASPESVNEGKHVQDIVFEHSISNSRTETSHPMIQVQYAYPDPYLSGLYAAYGPHAMFQHHVTGALPPGRVQIPADLPEDGPVYVNAKQYHGILRRRQTRAKLEAQNKLVKNRRPYLHESRHQHALNRVRGTGGRFLSKKNSEPHSPTSSQNVCGSFHFNHQGSMMNTNEHHRYTSTYHGTISAVEGASVSNSDTGFQPTVISMQGGTGGGGLVYGGNRHYVSSIVRRGVLWK